MIRRMTNQITTKELLDLDEDKALRIFAEGRESTVWALLKLSAIARQRAEVKVEETRPKSRTQR